MTQKDLSGRTVFQIASENSFYLVLQSPEIGTIVKKMWTGRLVHDGFLASSSFFRFIEDTSMRLSDPFDKFEERDHSKSYFYQFSLWKESCSLRYWPESISTICLIVIYNLYIYFLINSGQIMNKIKDIDFNLKILLYLYIYWTWSYNYNLLSLYIFCKLSKRKFILDIWAILELLLSIWSLLILLDTNELFNYYQEIYHRVENNLGIANSILNADKNFKYVKSDEKSDWPFIIRAIILSINDVLVWSRITGILLTFKDIGPLIRMIYLLGIQTMKYLVVYALYIACFSAVFTSIFYRVSDQFSSFSITLTTLFGGFINNLNAFEFRNDQILGAILLIFYVTLSGIILINLLIALLSNIYRSLSLEVDASHRSVLITYFRRYKWNKQYGFLLFLTTPLNFVNFIALPFFFLFRKKYSMEILSTKISKILYLIFYFPLMLILSIFYNIILLPICYLKGIINVLVYERQSKTNFLFKLYSFIKWLIFAPIFLVYILIRDIYYMFITVFRSFNVTSSEKDRIKKFMNEDDVILFLQFIHNRSREDRNDLHTLFIDFLLFEQEKKAEHDVTIKEKSYYLDKINNAAQKNSKHKAKATSSSFFLVSKTQLKKYKMSGKMYFEYSNEDNYNNHNYRYDKNINKNNQEKVSGNFVKRNIIIIEILENFLIDDGSDNYIVDIEKLKMLLPKRWNIDDSYIKRLVYTDITSLNRAVTKLKNSKNRILRDQLLNKISVSMTELDKSIDYNLFSNNNIENIKSSRITKSNNNSIVNSFSNSNNQRNDKNWNVTNSNNINFLSDDYEKKHFYENYLEFLRKISDNLNMNEEAKNNTKKNI